MSSLPVTGYGWGYRRGSANHPSTRAVSYADDGELTARDLGMINGGGELFDGQTDANTLAAGPAKWESPAMFQATIC